MSPSAHKTSLETAALGYGNPSKCAPFLPHMDGAQFPFGFLKKSGGKTFFVFLLHSATLKNMRWGGTLTAQHHEVESKRSPAVCLPAQGEAYVGKHRQ